MSRVVLWYGYYSCVGSVESCKCHSRLEFIGILGVNIGVADLL